MSGRSLFHDTLGRAQVWRLLVALSLCACLPRAAAQETPKGSDREEVVSVKSTLVNIDVTVKDKGGRYVTDLRPEDFTVFENGVRQKVDFFDPPPPPGAGDGPGRPGAPNGASVQRPPAQARNVISLVLDGQTTEQQNLKPLREGALKYIRERIAETDAVAVFNVAAGLQLLQPFTRDKAKLLSVVERAFGSAASSKTPERGNVAGNVGSRQSELNGLQLAEEGDPNTNSGAAGARLQAMVARRALEQFTMLRGQLSVQQSRPVIAALAALCEAQRGVPGKKTLVLFSQGFITSDSQDWQVQSLIDLANRANVAIYIIDAAGLRGGAPESGSYIPTTPLGGVSVLVPLEDRMRARAGENVFDNVKHEGKGREYDILYRISGDTGGRLIKGTNDIAGGLERIDDEIRSRYTLGYHSTDPNFDGGFRKLKVEDGRPGAQVVSRPGFYAIAHDNTVFFSPEDKKLLAGVAAAAEHPSMPLFTQLSPFRAAGGGYVIPLSLEISPGAVGFEQKGDKRHIQYDVLGVIRGAGESRVVSRLGGHFQIGLDERQYRAMLGDKLFLRQDLELGPGDYDLELIVRDRLSGKVAARRERLSLPEAGDEFSTSGVVLSRHVEAAGPQTAGTGDILSHAGVAIRPSPSREFRVADNLVIFFHLYNAGVDGGTGKPLVKVSVRLLADGRDAVKPMAYELTEPAAAPVPHLTFAKFVSLAPLRPGRFTVVVEARDATTGKLLRREEPFTIAP